MSYSNADVARGVFDAYHEQQAAPALTLTHAEAERVEAALAAAIERSTRGLQTKVGFEQRKAQSDLGAAQTALRTIRTARASFSATLAAVETAAAVAMAAADSETEQNSPAA